MYGKAEANVGEYKIYLWDLELIMVCEWSLKAPDEVCVQKTNYTKQRTKTP